MRLPVFLRVYRNGELENVKQFTDDQIVIGRNVDVQLSLLDDEISPLHAVIEERDSGYYVSDLGSATGTLLNGQKIFDERLESGDELRFGPYLVEFYIGVPKPKKGPSPNLPKDAPRVVEPTSKPVAPPPLPELSVSRSVKSEEPTAVASKESSPRESALGQSEKQDSGSPSTPPKMPEAVHQPAQRSDKGTYAPESKASAAETLKRFNRSAGSVVEVAVIWKERVISTHHYSGKASVTVGSSQSNDIVIPLLGMSRSSFTLLRLDQGACVHISPELSVTLIKGSSEFDLASLQSSGRIGQGSQGAELRLNSGEVLKLDFLGGTLSLVIRYVDESPKPLVAPFFDFSASETTALIMASVLSLLFAVYLTLYSEDPLEGLAQIEEPLRKAKVTFNPPKRKVKVAETPQKKKITEKSGNQTATTTKKDPGKSASLQKSPKKVTNKAASTVGQGGSINTGKKGANLQSKNRDVKQEGLLGVFGKGGTQKELSKAYSGTGELQGLAKSASGYAGANEKRAGDRLGSRLKDTGGGVKGTSTEGFSGVGTKGKGSGVFGYGSGGIGDKGREEINISGSDAEFTGTIDKEAIRRVIRENLRSFRFCYEKALRKNSSVYGKLILQWEIHEGGRARNVKAISNSTGDREFGQCIVGVLKPLRFPDPPPDEIAEVTYPFVFASQ